MTKIFNQKEVHELLTAELKARMNVIERFLHTQSHNVSLVVSELLAPDAPTKVYIDTYAGEEMYDDKNSYEEDLSDQLKGTLFKRKGLEALRAAYNKAADHSAKVLGDPKRYRTFEETLERQEKVERALKNAPRKFRQ